MYKTMESELDLNYPGGAAAAAKSLHYAAVKSFAEKSLHHHYPDKELHFHQPRLDHLDRIGHHQTRLDHHVDRLGQHQPPPQTRLLDHDRILQQPPPRLLDHHHLHERLGQQSRLLDHDRIGLQQHQQLSSRLLDHGRINQQQHQQQQQQQQRLDQHQERINNHAALDRLGQQTPLQSQQQPDPHDLDQRDLDHSELDHPDLDHHDGLGDHNSDHQHHHDHSHHQDHGPESLTGDHDSESQEFCEEKHPLTDFAGESKELGLSDDPNTALVKTALASDCSLVLKTDVVCNICKKSFISKGNLKKHLEMVHDAQPHTCMLCERDFVSKGNLKKHTTYVHDRGTGFPCDYPNCGKDFATKGNLKKHQQAVHEKLTVPCPTCNKHFSSNGNLKKHCQAIHDTLKFACEICKKEFSVRGNLKKHVLTVHKKEHLALMGAAHEHEGRAIRPQLALPAPPSESGDDVARLSPSPPATDVAATATSTTTSTKSSPVVTKRSLATQTLPIAMMELPHHRVPSTLESDFCHVCGVHGEHETCQKDWIPKAFLF